MRSGFRRVIFKQQRSTRTRTRIGKIRFYVAMLSFLLIWGRAGAFDYVTDANGTWWGIQDAASPRVDTGSIRATQTGAGVSAPFSTSINGFGGIRVLVQKSPAPR